jgi:hypothetical protein
LLTVENNIFTLCYKKALQLKTACLPPNAYTLFHKKAYNASHILRFAFT